MSNTKYYISKEGAKAIVDGVKKNFAPISHAHTKNDIKDLTFDSSLSSSSTNAVQNKVLASAVNTLEDTISGKANKTHTHSISDITNLQSALDGKASSSHGTHVTYSTTVPAMDGTASVGSATTVARSDHKHPTDTSRAAQTSLDSHTGNTTFHVTSAERRNWNTAYTHSQSSHAPSNAEQNQNAFSNFKIGDVTIAADIKTDTLTLVAGDNITITPEANNDKITISAKDTTYTLGSFGINATATELNKLKGVTVTTTEINYIDGVTSNVQEQLDNKVSTSRTINGKALSSNITLSAGDIGADASGTAQTKADNALSSAKNYTDTKISALINSAPTTLDTLGEIAIAMEENEEVVTALENAIGTKANTSDLTSHTSNKSNPHGVTIAQLGLGAAGSSLGLVKSGGDVTISSGVITVNDDSHNHTIANIDNLQTSLDGKQATINGGASTITSSNLTANRALISNGSGKVAVSAVTSTELGYLDGVTSNLQTQLDGKATSSHNHETHSQKSMSNTDLNTIKTAGWYYGYTGMTNAPAQSIAVMEVLVYSPDWIVQRFIVINGEEYIRHWHSANTWTNWKTNVDSGNIGSQSVNYATTAGSATKTTQDASGNVITSTYATKTELDTAKTNLQTSINGKANSSHTHTIANITNLQTTLDGKAASSHNHAASNITSGTLSSDRLPTVPIAKGGTGATTAAGALTNLGITATATELNYVDGVTSNIQTQLNGKSGTSHTHSYLPLSGGTITGQLDADKVFRNGNTFYNVLEFASTATVDEIVIKTKIPFISGNSMPLVHLKGYAYGESATIEMTVAFYIYNDKFTNMGVVSSCPWKPSVYLSSYTENNTKYVAISFAGSIYYPRFVIDCTDIWSGSGNRDYSSGWTSSNRASGETTSIIPSTDKVEVPYKPIANNISGNAATATNVAWSGVTSKPSYYDAKAIKGITRSGTTFTYTCMDGTTGTFTQQDNNTTYGVATTSANGLMSASDKAKFNTMELATLAEVQSYLGI